MLVDCITCQSQYFQYFDLTKLNAEESILSNYLISLRSSGGFSLLDTKKNSMMPNRICYRIQKWQQKFLKKPHNHRKKWVTTDDINDFTLTDEELKGEDNVDTYGVLLEGRFNGCCKCNNCHVGLWSCNVGITKNVDKEVLKKVFEDLDETIIPNTTDDKESLVTRISASKYLDDIVIYNPCYSILNKSLTSHQPKRRSEGVVKQYIHVYSGVDGEGQGKNIVTLPNYTSYGRHQDNWHGRPMKASTFLASLICWRACWNHLTQVSRKSPPTHCQMLFYYGALKSKMGYHRDNFNVEFIKNVVSGKSITLDGHPSGGGENSQIVGSNVLVLTMGSKPMKFAFRFPSLGNIQGKKSTYITSPRHHFTCGKLTISVLDPIDDVMMTHGASFVYSTRANKNQWYRVGYCFRWLQSFRDFYEETCTLRLDSSGVHRKRCGKKPDRDIYT